jgi:hypothetical protein
VPAFPLRCSDDHLAKNSPRRNAPDTEALLSLIYLLSLNDSKGLKVIY